MPKMTLVKALHKYCMLPSESLLNLREQYKLLTSADIKWFEREFAAVGVEIEHPKPLPITFEG